MKTHEECIKQVDTAFDRIFGNGCDEPLPVSLLRTAAKAIAGSYPGNRHRSDAIARIIDAVGCLKLAAGQGQTRNETVAKEVLYAVCRNEDETVTLTVFEDENIASVDLDEGLLQQLCETLSHYAR